MPSKKCWSCNGVKKKQLYSNMQWKLKDKDGHLVGSCLTCVADFKSATQTMPVYFMLDLFTGNSLSRAAAPMAIDS